MNNFLTDVENIFNAAENEAAFIAGINKLLSSQVSGAFCSEKVIAHDMQYYFDVAEEYSWTQKQFCMAIADYISKARKLDLQSIQKNHKQL